MRPVSLAITLQQNYIHVKHVIKQGGGATPNLHVVFIHPPWPLQHIHFIHQWTFPVKIVCNSDAIKITRNMIHVILAIWPKHTIKATNNLRINYIKKQEAVLLTWLELVGPIRDDLMRGFLGPSTGPYTDLWPVSGEMLPYTIKNKCVTRTYKFRKSQQKLYTTSVSIPSCDYLRT